VGMHAYGSVCIKKIEAEAQAPLFGDLQSA
jgi:hypothetical protein